ncbi:glycosyltransferase family 9 protein [Geobacter pickeringii]|uniref:glycosyltransferase family 9 protein n=1 Tax=Geobacter pickeringii TaxID=345632 RepID=UPI000A004F61|nr:glycosyltransferase family 9 protein [Geobacter pickeringii]
MDRSVIIDEKDSRGAGLKFLIVSLRYIGDVLLSTPLALSIKARYPDAVVDYAVFRGTEGILFKNPSVGRIISMEPGKKNLSTISRLFRQYDVAIGANPSDRTSIVTALAGRRSVGFSYRRANEWWKELIFDQGLLYDDNLHIVPLTLQLLGPLGIPPRTDVIMGFDEEDEMLAGSTTGTAGYVVLHPFARKHYKCWTATEWGRLAGIIRDRTGLRPIFTRSPSSGDDVILRDILAHSPPDTVFLKEPLTLNQLAAVLSKAKGFVGVDTVVTHMAAALDVPLVALYGPTMVRHWGPWPNGICNQAPYRLAGSVQRMGRITVVQKEWDCVPCNRETCSQGDNVMRCLCEITADEVFDELSILLDPNGIRPSTEFAEVNIVECANEDGELGSD